MRLANVNGRLTAFIDGQPTDVEKASDGCFGSDPQAVYEQWDEFTRWAAEAGARGDGPVADEDLGAPAPRPRQVFAIGVNYSEHADEANTNVPDAPLVFTKFPTCIVGPGHVVDVVGETTDWEIELVAVIGRLARNVPRADAWDYIAGVTVGQDLSDRTLQLVGGGLPQFSLGKSRPGYGPIGPWLVTPDELPDRDDLALVCRVDGETVQEARTSEMIFPVPELIASLSAACPLLPGDVIFTGTPSGVGMGRKPPLYLRPGQQLVSSIEGIGDLRTRLAAQ